MARVPRLHLASSRAAVPDTAQIQKSAPAAPSGTASASYLPGHRSFARLSLAQHTTTYTGHFYLPHRVEEAKHISGGPINKNNVRIRIFYLGKKEKDPLEPMGKREGALLVAVGVLPV